MTIDQVTTLVSQDFDGILRPLSHQGTQLGLDRLKISKRSTLLIIFLLSQNSATIKDLSP